VGTKSKHSDEMNKTVVHL